MSASAWAVWLVVDGVPTLKVSVLGEQQTYHYFHEGTANAIALAILRAGPAPLPEPEPEPIAEPAT